MTKELNTANKMLDDAGIIGTINKEDLLDQISKNLDPYGNAVNRISLAVMKSLDNFEGEFNIGYHPDKQTAHGVICTADNEGITGFQAGCLAKMILMYHKKGLGFFISHILNKHNLEDENFHSERAKAISECDILSVSHVDVMNCINDMIKRYKEIGDK